MKPIQLIPALLLLSNITFAYDIYTEVPIGNKTYTRLDFMISTIHLGDGVRKTWEEPTPRMFFEKTFELYGMVSDAKLFMDVFEVDNGCNTVRINGVKVSNICVHNPDSFLTCPIRVPDSALRKGENTIRIDTCTEDAYNFDDFQVKNIYLLFRYTYYEPHILTTKTLSKYVVPPNMTVNVTVILANVGMKPAYNVTSVDFIPQKSRLVAGSREKTFELIAGGETARYQYPLSSDAVGWINSTPGVVAYSDGKGSNYTSTIEETFLNVAKTEPKVVLRKNVSASKIKPAESFGVTITLSNVGLLDVYNVTVTDYPTGGLSVANGSETAYYAMIPRNSTVSYSYLLKAERPLELSFLAQASYSSPDGGRFSADSNYASISVAQPDSQANGKLINADLLLRLLAVVAVVAVALYVIYMKVA